MATEPASVPAIRRSSLLWLPASEYRSAPEEFLLELNRVVFWGLPTGAARNRKEQRLSPEWEELNDKERFSLYCFRGRQQAGGARKGQDWYAPAYPQLARGAWLREKASNTVNQFLLRGPIGHFLRSLGTDAREERAATLAGAVVDALLGGSVTPEPSDREEPFAASMIPVSEALGEDAPRAASSELKSLMLHHAGSVQTPAAGTCDRFSEVATQDLATLLEKSRELPRHHWVMLLMCFLRYVIPLWAMSQSRGVAYLDGWLVDAIDGRARTEPEVERAFIDRGQSLMCPTRSASRCIEEMVTAYMRARIRCRILWSALLDCGVMPAKLASSDARLEVAGSGPQSICVLLESVRAAREKFLAWLSSEHGVPGTRAGLRRFLTSRAENYTAWTRPTKQGPGKRLSDMMNVLRKFPDSDDSESFLLEQPDPGFLAFSVQPGPLAYQLFTMLAADAQAKDPTRRRELVLRDVDEHFARYGIDFGGQPDGRSMLLDGLTRLGLAKGSPDAGDSVKIRSPYAKARSKR